MGYKILACVLGFVLIVLLYRVAIWFLFLRNAHKRLLLLRQKDGWGKKVVGPLNEYSFLIYFLNRCGNYNLEDETQTKLRPERIGSSKAEIEQFRKDVYAFTTEQCLEALRGGTNLVDAELLEQYIEFSGRPLSDFGVDQNKLDELFRTQKVHEIQGMWEGYLEKRNPHALMAFILEQQKTGISWKELDIDENLVQREISAIASNYRGRN
jgi:hypothetical protein